MTATSANTAAGRYRGTKDNKMRILRLTSASAPGNYFLMFVSIYLKEVRNNIIVNYLFCVYFLVLNIIIYITDYSI